MDSKSIFNTLALLSKDYTNPEYFDVPQIFAALDCNGEFCLFDQNGKRLENVIIVEKKENAYEFRVGNYTGKYLIKESLPYAMLTDSHIHIGQFYDTYTSPENLVRYLDAVGVERFAVSSTTICEGDYMKVVNELTDLVSIAGSRAFPTLWVLPSMFEDGGIERFLNSAIVWRFLKIHPQLHPNTWTESATCTASLLSLARKLRIPVLIHTGEREGCQPELLREMVAGNSDITFIFAHGRPLQQTAEIMQECPNVWCDTAFMPIKNIASLCGLGLSERILWGTDYPIISHFRPDCDAVAYYSGLLEELKASVSDLDFQKITADNFSSVTS